MEKDEEPESKKPGIWDVSPISPKWTIAVVVALIVLLTVVLRDILIT